MAERLDRPTTTLTTPANNTFVLNAYLTGREAAAIKSLMLSSLKMTMGDLESKRVDMGGISGEVLAQQERKTLECLLVSVNGDVENPVEKLLDMPASELDAVLAEIEKIKNPTSPEN